MTARKIKAIHPESGGIVYAYLYLNYFGKGKHAIRFQGINSPYYAEKDIPWEEI